MQQGKPITVVETPEFLSATRKLFDETERAALVEYLAYNPSVGVVIPGAGGIRKIRWGLEGRGKRGGARIIYFFHNLEMPLFLLTAYAKNDQADLSRDDYASFQQLTRMLVDSYRVGRVKP